MNLKLLQIWLGDNVPEKYAGLMRHNEKIFNWEEIIFVCDNKNLKLPYNGNVTKIFIDELPEIITDEWSEEYIKSGLNCYADLIRLYFAKTIPNLVYFDVDILAKSSFFSNLNKQGKPYLGQWGCGVEFHTFFVNGCCDYFVWLGQELKRKSPWNLAGIVMSYGKNIDKVYRLTGYEKTKYNRSV